MISYAARKSLIRDSIYTRKLVLRGDLVPESLRADLQFTRRAASVMNSHLGILPAATRLQYLPSSTNEVFVVIDGSGGVAGAVIRESLSALGCANPNAVIGDGIQRNFVVVSLGDSVWTVVAAKRSADSAFALVAPHAGDLSANSVRGIITRKIILDVLADDMDVFGV